MNLNIFSDLRKPGLVSGKSLSPSTKIYSVKEKYPTYKNTHSFHARPKTKASGQLVGIADYMGASLEMNHNHTIKNNFKHTDRHITYKDKTTDMIVEKTIFDLYKTFDNARAYTHGKYIVSMM